MKKKKCSSTSKGLTMDDIIKAKEALMKINIPSIGSANVACYNATDSITYLDPISFGSLSVSAPCAEKCTGNKGNNPMYIENDKHIQSARIQYLQSRLSDVTYEKNRELTKTFRIHDDEAPASPKELVERITAGLYIMPTDEQIEADRKYYGGSALRSIKWRDPKKPADKDGYDKAYDALQAEKTKAQDVISIASPEAGLTALQAFEAWQPTGKAS